MFSWLKSILFVLCSTLLMVTGFAQAELVSVPTLSARVTDLTHSLSQAEQAQLEQKLAAFEQQKGSQIAVLILPTTQPEDIAQYSIRVVDAWKLGRKGVGDGVLLLIAKDDHKMRIEVGRGLEGAIPDLYAKRIISEDIAPKFKQADFIGGLNAGVDKLVRLVNGEALPEPSKIASHSKGIDSLLPILLFGGLISGMLLRGIFGTFLGSAFNGGLLAGVVWMLGSALGGATVLGLIAFFITMMLGSRGFGGMPMSGGSGGWSSGSNSRSWGGGGGGDFGGGGASGGW